MSIPASATMHSRHGVAGFPQNLWTKLSLNAGLSRLETHGAFSRLQAEDKS